MSRGIIRILFFLSACAQFAIGRIYDDRLSFFGINLSVVNFLIFISTASIFIYFIGRIHFYSKSKIILYSFYSGMLILNPILWMVYNVSEYGFFKYINFIIILIPISIIVIERFTYRDVLTMCKILFWVTLLLSFLALFGVSISENPDHRRLSVLGGGPIIFSRWMGYGILLLIFSPIKINKILKVLLVLTFFALAFASGSRAPVLSIVFILLLFLILNFRAIFVRAIFFSFLLIITFFSFGISEYVAELGKGERVFMNISDIRDFNKSTGTRIILLEGSINILKAYPLGVGSGNYQIKANDISSTKLVPLEYPHNIILEITNEQGVVMALILVLLFIYVVSLAFQKMKLYRYDKTSLYPFLFYSLLYFSINISISGDINDSRIWFLFASFIIIERPLINKEENIIQRNIQEC